MHFYDFLARLHNKFEKKNHYRSLFEICNCETNNTNNTFKKGAKMSLCIIFKNNHLNRYLETHIFASQIYVPNDTFYEFS